MAAGISGYTAPEAMTWPRVRDHVDRLLLVSDAGIKAATLLMLNQHSCVVEPFEHHQTDGSEEKMKQSIENHQQVNATKEYSTKWQARFDFFDRHGAPNTPGFKQALKQLPFRQKVRVNFNFIAFFFGPIYLFVLGLWKKNLSLILIILAVYTILTIALAIAGMEFPRSLEVGLGYGFNALYGIGTNYSYYLKERKGDHGWNPFKGMRW